MAGEGWEWGSWKSPVGFLRLPENRLPSFSLVCLPGRSPGAASSGTLEVLTAKSNYILRLTSQGPVDRKKDKRRKQQRARAACVALLLPLV